jgi:nucleotide-binding universal stress UspA family protein
MDKRILLPLDGSAVAEQELPTLPRPATSPETMIQESEAATVSAARDYLEGIAAQVSHKHKRTQGAVVIASPHEQILSYPEENQIDLIVTGTRGQTGFLSRFLMGSVSDRVVRGARVPLLMARAAEDTAQSG